MGQTQSKSIAEYNYQDLTNLIEKSDDYLQDQWKKISDTNSTSYWFGETDQSQVSIHKGEWPLKVSQGDLKEGHHYFRLTDNGKSHYYNADEDRWADSATPSDVLDDLSDKWNNLLQSAQDYAKTQSEKQKADLIEAKVEQVGGDSENQISDIPTQTSENLDSVPMLAINPIPFAKEVQKEYTLTLKAGETYEITDLGHTITNISPETMIICSSDCNEQREMGSVATIEISSDLNQLLRTIEIYWLGGIANPSTGVGDLPLITILYGADQTFNQISIYYESKYALNVSHISNENLEQIINFFDEHEMPYK